MSSEELKKAHRRRFVWMEDVLADTGLTPAQKNVAIRLALHKNIETGRCDPGLTALAEETALTRRGVQKALDAIDNAGWIRRTVGGHGQKDTNDYELTRANGGSPYEASEMSGEHRGTSRDIAPRANGGTVMGERKSEPDAKEGRTVVRPNTENITNTEKNNDHDHDVDARPATHQKRDSIEAKSLAIELAKIAGLAESLEWPLHWQNAIQVILGWWKRGWSTEVILSGARLTMRQKRSSDPVASIEYFQPQIEEIVKIRSRKLTPLEQGRCLREIAAKSGWEAIVRLSVSQSEELVERWSKGLVTDDELQQLMADIPRAASGS